VVAQKAIITKISSVNPNTKEKEFFPVIKIPGNKIATKKINKLIREEALYLDSTGFKKNIFEVAWDRNNPNNPSWEYDSFDFKVYSNKENYTCLQISFVGGKHAQMQEIFYFFDNANGNKISYEQLIDSPGQKWLVDTMTIIGKRRIEKLMPSLLDSLKVPFIPKDDEDSLQGSDFQKEYEMYKACLEYDHVPSDFEYLSMFVNDNFLFVTGFGCAENWHELRLDELGDVRISININSIDRFLTPYGRKLLLGSKK
jgi:hypothetical protein